MKVEEVVPKHDKANPKGYSYQQRHVFNLLKLKSEDFSELIKQYDTLEKISKALNINRMVLSRMAKKYLYSDTETYWDYFKRIKAKTKNSPKKKKYNNYFELRFKQILNGVIINGIKKNDFLNALFHYGYKKKCCEVCGYSNQRVSDKKVGLLLAQLDKKDLTNYKLDNLKVMCYNCYFENIGDVSVAFKTYLKNKETNKLIKTESDMDYNINWQIEDDTYKTDYDEIDEKDLISRKK